MKRPLIVLAAGFVLGEVLALQSQTAVFPGLLWRLFAASGLVGLCLFGRYGKYPNRNKQGGSAKKTALLLFFVLAALGCAAGFGRGRWEKERLDEEERLALNLSGARLKLRGRIGSLERGDNSTAIVLEEAEALAGMKRVKFSRVMAYVQEEGGMGQQSDAELLPGMTVEMRGKLEPVEGPRNPGEFNFRLYYRSKGAVCRLFGEEIKIMGRDQVPYRTFLMRFRDQCSGILDRICLPEDAPVFKAVLLGDTSGMEPEMRTLYQRHGISHLLAVSGQHLAVMGGGIYLLMRRLGLGYGKAGVLSAGLVVSYGIMTGSSGSAMRAVIMILCLWLAAKEGRSYDTLSGLGLAALLLLWKAPYLLFQSGFQLSFGAVLAIGGLGSWLKSGLGLEGGYKNTVLMSLCVQIVITPVVLYHYYQHPLYGIFLNLLVIPLISVLMYSGLLGIGLGSFWLRGGTAAVGAGHYVLCVYEWLCRQVEHLPGYCLVLGRPSLIQIVIYGAGLAAAFYVLAAKGQRKRKLESIRGEDGSGKETRDGGGCAGEEKKRGTPRGPWVYLPAIAGLYCLFFLVLLPIPRKGMEIIVMDVGQGDGILMHGGGFSVLVDGGSSSEKKLGSKTMESCIKCLGITEIDYAVVSHGDSDHINGLLYLLQESQDIKIRNLILPAMGRGQEVYDMIGQAAEQVGSRVFYMKPADCIQAGELSLTCLYAGGTTVKEGDRNTHSLVICADYRNFHMLFTGDMGKEQEHELASQALMDKSLAQYHLSHVEVLKTAHHGSITSSSEEFLDYLNPALAVISYGRGNSYGHPSPEVIARMKSRQIPIMETGTGGAVLLRTDGKWLDCRYFMKSHDEKAHCSPR